MPRTRIVTLAIGLSALLMAAALPIPAIAATVTEPGTYRVSGTLSDGQLIVESEDDGVVRRVLDGVDITSSTGAAVAVLEADKTVVWLAEDAANVLEDATDLVFPDPEEDEPNTGPRARPPQIVISGGDIGIVSATVLGGDIALAAGDDAIHSADDGLNVAGDDASSSTPGGTPGGGAAWARRPSRATSRRSAAAPSSSTRMATASTPTARPA
jgi:hypothetical protein